MSEDIVSPGATLKEGWNGMGMQRDDGKARARTSYSIGGGGGGGGRGIDFLHDDVYSMFSHSYRNRYIETTFCIVAQTIWTSFLSILERFVQCDIINGPQSQGSV